MTKKGLSPFQFPGLQLPALELPTINLPAMEIPAEHLAEIWKNMASISANCGAMEKKLSAMLPNMTDPEAKKMVKGMLRNIHSLQNKVKP